MGLIPAGPTLIKKVTGAPLKAGGVSQNPTTYPTYPPQAQQPSWLKKVA